MAILRAGVTAPVGCHEAVTLPKRVTAPPTSKVAVDDGNRDNI